MKSCHSILSLLILTVAVMAPKISWAADEKDFIYQIESAAFPNRTEFYFFRFEKDTGAVQVLKYDGEAGSGKPVNWHDMRDKKAAFTYIIHND